MCSQSTLFVVPPTDRKKNNMSNWIYSWKRVENDNIYRIAVLFASKVICDVAAILQSHTM